MEPNEADVGPLRAWRAGRSDFRLQLLSVLSLSVAFVCLAASLLIVTNIAVVRDRWSKAGRATVYLREGVEEAAILDLARALEATPGVKKVRHVTSLEARREVVFDEGDKALAALPPSAFPASLEVGFSDEVDEQELAAMTL
ncbi:MAG TPA: permease-like cell division protein FtsX, partial [Polyangiaceae bacterium]|nr:permease-like cell division protein FtsX [Polyangiaceae bacterium]